MTLETPCLDFLGGRRPTNNGDYVDEIIGWSDAKWEECHDHIQWCFPTKEPSKFNLKAPLLTNNEIAIFLDLKENRAFQSSIVVDNLEALSRRFLMFLSLDLRFGLLGWSDVFQIPDWPIDFNHNWLRITRYMTCLRYFGYSSNALDVYQFLSNHIAKNETTLQTFQFWEKAAIGELL
jgi:hypothetical protein